MDLREGLDQLPLAALRKAAERLGVAADATSTRDELATRLFKHLSEPTFLAEQVRLLDAPERALLAAARRGDGEIRGFMVAQYLGDDEGRLEALLETGLLFRGFSIQGPLRGEVFTLPAEVSSVLGEKVPEGTAGSAALPPAIDPPASAQRRSTDPAFSLFVWASFRERTNSWGEQEGASLAQFRQETAAWAHEPSRASWSSRWEFLTRLARTCGLVDLERRSAAPHFLRRFVEALDDRPRLTTALWHGYLRDHDSGDVERAGIPRAPEIAAQLDAPSLRLGLVQALAALPADRWASMDAVYAWLRQSQPDFLRRHLDRRAAALTDPATGALLFREGTWSQIEAPLLRSLLLGPFYWLGILICDEQGERMALTRRGQTLLRDLDLPARAAGGCVWEEGRILRAPASTSLGALLEVEQFLTLLERGQPSRYRLDSDRFGRALETGHSPDLCRYLLRRLTGTELPAAIEESVADWSEKYGALLLRPAVLLEGRNEQDLNHALRVPEVAARIKQARGGRAVEIASSQAGTVADALRAAGFLPHVDAALRLVSTRQAYSALVDERALEFLTIALLSYRDRVPELLATLEGATALLERLEELFDGERLMALRDAAASLMGPLDAPRRPGPGRRPNRRRPTRARG